MTIDSWIPVISVLITLLAGAVGAMWRFWHKSIEEAEKRSAVTAKAEARQEASVATIDQLKIEIDELKADLADARASRLRYRERLEQYDEDLTKLSGAFERISRAHENLVKALT